MATPTLAEALEASTERCRNMDAPLGARLQSFADDVRRLDPVFAAKVDRMVARLVASQAGHAAPAVGEPMPSFLLPDQDGSLVSLEQMLDRGPVAISMHRGHWCPYCRINANALSQMTSDVGKAGAQIVAIAPELQPFTSQLRSDATSAFPVLTDLDNAYALELSVAIWVGEEMRDAMQSAGFDISVFNGNSSWLLPIPATFVVGVDGLVKARYVNPDYRTRMDPAQLIDVLRRL